MGPAFALPWLLWLSVIVVSSGAFVSGFVWLAWRFKAEWTRTAWAWTTGVLVVVSLLMLLFFVGIPSIIHLARPFYLTSSAPSRAGTTKTSTVVVTAVGLAGLLGSWLAAAGRLLATPKGIEGDIVKGVGGFAKTHRTLLVNVVATIAGPLLVLTGIIILAYWGSAYAPGGSGAGLVEILAWVGTAGLLGILWFRADVTAWSLFPMYRRRLSAGFVLRRTKVDGSQTPTSVCGFDASERPYSKSYKLTECQPDDFPEVIICAAANVSDYGATPAGSNVTSFTFSSQWIGGPIVGAKMTSEYEQAVGIRAQSRFTTLPTAMAISGAAFAPSMGRMTRIPFRFFLALANLRLGVWVPNPRRLDKFEGRNVVHQVLPRPQYFVREMFGRNHLDAPFLYITDGGHYENLGLVELLRRKCETIWCIDAAGDRVDTFDTLGGALQLAQAELQISIDINPARDMDPQPAKTKGAMPQYVKQPFCFGAIHYPDGGTGTLIHIKAGVPIDSTDSAGAEGHDDGDAGGDGENSGSTGVSVGSEADTPWNIISFAQQHPKFPSDPTLDQLYDGDHFDAYRQLGAISAERAWKRWQGFQRTQSGQPPQPQRTASPQGAGQPDKPAQSSPSGRSES